MTTLLEKIDIYLNEESDDLHKTLRSHGYRKAKGDADKYVKHTRDRNSGERMRHVVGVDRKSKEWSHAAYYSNGDEFDMDGSSGKGHHELHKHLSKNPD